MQSKAIPMSGVAENICIAMLYISLVSTRRCERWHGSAGLQDWSVLEWAGAMCGEAGEAANVAKKIKRELSGMKNGLSAGSIEKLDKKLGQECADTFLYLVLLAASRNIDLGKVIVETFNKKSEEYGFPERL